MNEETGGIPKEAQDFDAAKAKANFEAKIQKDYFRDPADSAFAKKEQRFGEREPIGDVILGKVDPRTLSEKEFQSSPERLFHGARQNELDFDDSVDYTTTSLDTQVFSSTIGSGFYTTNELKNAQVYADMKQGKMYEFLPFQAGMLDMRAKGNSRFNAPVQPDFAKDWVEFYEKNRERAYDNSDLSQIAIDMLKSQDRIYLKLLKNRVESGRAYNLRQLLDRTPTPTGTDTQHASGTFAAFMLEKGYDGLIYIEGGDHEEHQGHVTSVVFFNPKKIGTYEVWQKRKQEGK